MKRSAQDLHLITLKKLAKDFPDMRAQLLPLIQDQVPASERYASQVKEAFNEESQQFVAWCLMKDDKWSATECQRFLDKIGVPFIETLDAPKRGPLEKGEQVKCNAITNTNAKNTDTCHTFDNQIGIVIDVDKDFLMVEFESGKKARFEGTTSGKETGLGRHKATSEETQTRANMELVYISDTDAKPPSKLSIQRVQEYLDKGSAGGETRSDIYHTGQATVQTTNKQKQYYVKYWDLTRGRDYRSFNPIKGQVLYLGSLGHRPGGWKNEFAQMVAASAAAGDDKE